MYLMHAHDASIGALDSLCARRDVPLKAYGGLIYLCVGQHHHHQRQEKRDRRGED